MARRSLIHEVERRERSGRWFPAFAGLLVISLLASTWIGLFSFMGANAAYGTFSDLEDRWIPDTETMQLSFPDLSRVSRIYASGGELLAELHDGRISEPVPIDLMPDIVINAVLAAEDEDFYEHDGVDFRAIASAAVDNILSDTTRGGSTITQQLVKNLFVGDEITIERKVQEALVAAELERRFTKNQILEFYLNSAFFGSNAYGVNAAAEQYFQKELGDVTVAEAATIAVTIRNPSVFNPRRNPDLVLDRRNRVIRNMEEEGWITPTEGARALKEPMVIAPRTSITGIADHVVAEVKRQMLDDPEFAFLGETRDDRKKAIFGCPADDEGCAGGGGLRIETTIDLPAQRAANDILQTWFTIPENNFEACQELFPDRNVNSLEFLEVYATSHTCAPTGALATVENHTGAVITMASAVPFDFNQFDFAVQGQRNPGSTMKPITLVTALELGESLASRWNGASPQTFECPYRCSDEGNKWTVSNAGAGYGRISLAQATTNSVNTVYAALALKIGPENIVSMAERMGITSQLRPVPSITLGTSEVSPLDMASAFTNFATNGLHAENYLVSRILDADGEVIYEREVRQNQVADPAIFAAARSPLLDVPTGSGTAPRANIDVPQGGKTGTTQNFTDAWFVGFTPNYSTAVWTGFPGVLEPLRNVTINGETYSRVFGGTVAAPIWAEYMKVLLADEDPGVFPDLPEEDLKVYFEIPTTQVPSVVGLDVESAKTALSQANLIPWEVPFNSLSPAGTVLGQSAAAGATVEQGVTVYMNVSTGVVPTVTLPQRLIGMTQADAIFNIQLLADEAQATLNVSVEEVQGQGRPGVVIGMNPAPGATVGSGATITLFISR
jgi:penicillin-binding protein 1A